jgi:hypothetical protein
MNAASCATCLIRDFCLVVCEQSHRGKNKDRALNSSDLEPKHLMKGLLSLPALAFAVLGGAVVAFAVSSLPFAGCDSC